MIAFSTAERKVLGVAAPTQQQTDTWIYPAPPNPYGLQPRLVGFVNQCTSRPWISHKFSRQFRR